MKFEGIIYFDIGNGLDLISDDANSFLLSKNDSYILFENPFHFEYSVFVSINTEHSFQFKKFHNDHSLDFEECVANSELDVGLLINPDGSLRISRNPFGTVPLYYIFVPNTFFAFSTSLSSLVKKDIVRNYLELNVERISSYCTFVADPSHQYDESTFFKSIKTILPGHILKVEPTGIDSTPYLYFDPDQWNHLNDASDYSNQLLIALKDSIYKYAKNGSIASHLSGGMDSSSVSALTKHLFPNKPLHTLYANTDTDFNRESMYSKLVSQKINSIHHEVKPATNDFELLVNLTAEYAQPEQSVSSPGLHVQLMAFAKSQGCTVLLNGLSGDTIIGMGHAYLEELVNLKDWKTLKPILEELSTEESLQYHYEDWIHFSHEKKYQLTIDHFFALHMARIYRQLGLAPMIEFYRSAQAYFNISYIFLLKKIYEKVLRYNNNKPHINTILKPEYSNLFSKSKRNPPTYTKSKNVQALLNISYIYNRASIRNNESHFVLSNYLGIHNKMAMFSKAIIEICSATPDKFKFGNGFGRTHFRNAMKELLPTKVTERRSKGIYTLYARESALRIVDQSKEFLTDDHEVWNYIDRDLYNSMKKILLQDNQHYQVYNRPQFHVLRTIALAIWLSWFDSIKKTPQSAVL